MSWIHRGSGPAATCLAVAGTVRLIAWAVASPLEAARAGRATFDDLLALAAGTGGVLVLGYAALLLSLTVATAVPGAAGRLAGSVAELLTPAALRGAARVALGAGLVTGSVAATVPAAASLHAVPAAATTTTLATGRATAAPAEGTVGDVAALPPIGRPGGSAGWSPTALPPGTGTARPPVARPDPAPRPAAPPGPAPATLLAGAPREDAGPVDGAVVVRRGDSLWAVAARALGPGATDAQIAAEWPRWFAANRDVVGDDPHLILPGTVLRPPGQH